VSGEALMLAVQDEKKRTPSKWMAHLPLRLRLPVVTVLVVIFFVSVSSVPIWNKYISKGTLPDSKPFPYALTVSFLQLVGTDVLLLCVVLVTASFHGWRSYRRSRLSEDASAQELLLKETAGEKGANADEDTAAPQRFYFTHRFWFKLWHTIPIGVLFGFKLGLTNWGLFLAPTVNFHLLIQASSLFFVIFFAFLVLNERPTVWALLCAVGATSGAILVSLEFNEDWALGSRWWVIGVNFASAVFEGLSIVFLRRARNILANTFPEDRDVFLIIQITMIKLVISALTVLPFALLIEGWLYPPKEGPVWDALANASITLLPYMFFGSILTFLFQSDYTALTFIAGAQDVGVLSHIKIVPQVSLSEAVFHNLEPTWEKILGLVLVVLSGVSYAVLKGFRLTHIPPRKPDAPPQHEGLAIDPSLG